MNKRLLRIQKFVSFNSSKFIIFTLAVVVLNFFDNFPYLNTLLTYPFTLNVLIFLFLLLVILFKLNESFSFSISLVLIFISACLSVFRKDSAAQSVGTISYYLLWFGLVQMVFRNYMNKNESR